RSRQPPADLDGWREMRFGKHVEQPGEADEIASLAFLQRVIAIAARLPMRLDAIDEGIRLVAAERGGEELHDGRIGAHGGEGRAVGVPPAAEAKAGRLDRLHAAKSLRR